MAGIGNSLLLLVWLALLRGFGYGFLSERDGPMRWRYILAALPIGLLWYLMLLTLQYLTIPVLLVAALPAGAVWLTVELLKHGMESQLVAAGFAVSAGGKLMSILAIRYRSRALAWNSFTGYVCGGLMIVVGGVAHLHWAGS